MVSNLLTAFFTFPSGITGYTQHRGQHISFLSFLRASQNTCALWGESRGPEKKRAIYKMTGPLCLRGRDLFLVFSLQEETPNGHFLHVCVWMVLIMCAISSLGVSESVFPGRCPRGCRCVTPGSVL